MDLIAKAMRDIATAPVTNATTVKLGRRDIQIIRADDNVTQPEKIRGGHFAPIRVRLPMAVATKINVYHVIAGLAL